MVNTGCVKGINLAITTDIEVMQQFVDDTLLFGESSVMEAKAWKTILHNHEESSGQQVNYYKSKIYFFNIDSSLQRKIRNILGCHSANLPDTYLGLLLTTK